jgi:hypothetical protein
MVCARVDGDWPGRFFAPLKQIAEAAVLNLNNRWAADKLKINKAGFCGVIMYQNEKMNVS